MYEIHFALRIVEDHFEYYAACGPIAKTPYVVHVTVSGMSFKSFRKFNVPKAYIEASSSQIPFNNPSLYV